MSNGEVGEVVREMMSNAVPVSGLVELTRSVTELAMALRNR